jgi:hypothetical protein
MTRVSEVQYLTVTCFGQILRVTHLRDRFDHVTDDPALAERCIIVFPDGTMAASTTDEAPVYTVH